MASSYINVDDTGARHQGKNGVCTHIGNDLFAWFESASSKSRTNFLTLLCAGDVRLIPNTDAEREAIQKVRDEIWALYRELLEYKKEPTEKR
jgi:hypothetical protein